MLTGASACATLCPEVTGGATDLAEDGFGMKRHQRSPRIQIKLRRYSKGQFIDPDLGDLVSSLTTSRTRINFDSAIRFCVYIGSCKCGLWESRLAARVIGAVGPRVSSGR